jgi:hypothetical protein
VPNTQTITNADTLHVNLVVEVRRNAQWPSPPARRLAGALKSMLRRFGVRCLSIEPATAGVDGAATRTDPLTGSGNSDHS